MVASGAVQTSSRRLHWAPMLVRSDGPYLFGLAAGGEAGVDRALTLLRDEFTRTLALSGVNDQRQLKERHVRKVLPSVVTDAREVWHSPMHLTRPSKR